MLVVGSDSDICDLRFLDFAYGSNISWSVSGLSCLSSFDFCLPYCRMDKMRSRVLVMKNPGL